jgi:cell division transport system permease protein
MRFRYFLSETLTNLRRNLLMTIAAISTVAISLLLLGGVQILGMIVNNVTFGWEAKVEISAFLRGDAQPGEITDLETEVAGMPEVENVTFVSKEEAFEEFKQRYASQPEFYENITAEDLPASLRIKLTDADYTEAVASRIRGAPAIDEVRFGGEFVKRLLQVNSVLRTITFGMSLVLLIAAAALIANTIRLAIYSRREEIGIMKLVGATNWFIRIPFMLEGVFAALVGALAAAAIVVAADLFVFSRIGQVPLFEQAFNFSSGEILTVLGLLGAVGVLIGLVGSGMALRRFLEPA